MSKYDTNKLIAHLKVKWAGRPCPMCLVGNWEVQDSIFQIMEFNEGSLVIGGPIVPLVPVTCKNCGNTILLNAIVSGAHVPPPIAPPPGIEGGAK